MIAAPGKAVNCAGGAGCGSKFCAKRPLCHAERVNHGRYGTAQGLRSISLWLRRVKRARFFAGASPRRRLSCQPAQNDNLACKTPNHTRGSNSGYEACGIGGLSDRKLISQFVRAPLSHFGPTRGAGGPPSAWNARSEVPETLRLLSPPDQAPSSQGRQAQPAQPGQGRPIAGGAELAAAARPVGAPNVMLTGSPA